MPLLDIAIAQSSYQNHLSYTKVQLFVNARVPNYSLLKCEEKWASLRKSFHNPANTKPRHEFIIKVVATLESKRVVHSKDEEQGKYVLPPTVPSFTVHNGSSSEDLEEEVETREKLRRMRISKANKGNTPWNKGRKHSPETLRLIKEKTRLAMQNPKVKLKLASGHAQSEETREKIAVGVRLGWQRRREKLLLQETCLSDWQNLISEAAKNGFSDEDDLQWNSYEILNEQLQQKWLDSIEFRKTTPRPKGSKRAPKSLEQRKKIGEAIAAKWANPEYRSKVRSGLAKYHGIPEGVEWNPRRRKPSGEGRQSADSPKNKTGKTESSISYEIKARPRKLKLKNPKFKDPLASTKLEMLKSIRAQRASSSSSSSSLSSSGLNKHEAVKRAKLLIGEAEKAAKSLEVVAKKNPVARASLLETRKLIAEAIQSIETIENVKIITEDLNHTAHKGMMKGRDFDLYQLTMMDEMGADCRLPTSLNGYELEILTQKVDSGKLKDNYHHSKPNCVVRLNGNGAKLQNYEELTSKTATKKWVRGRLVGVAERE